MKTVQSFFRAAVNRCLRPVGYQLVRNGCYGGRYIDAKATVQAAKARGQSVCEYVEELWDQQGATARVVQEMSKVGCLAPGERVLEIGAGTGRYLELVLRKISPEQYEIYETADDWASWLANTYGPYVVRQPADGRTLRYAPSHSCGWVHAHGVFVYLSLLHAFEYFAEMIRVCKPQGSIVFDFYPAEAFDEAMILRWLQYDDRYPVVLPAAHVRSFFVNRGCCLIHEFDNPHGHGRSHYFVFRLHNPVPGAIA
jgi:SAM-dependent methyltransferase